MLCPAAAFFECTSEVIHLPIVKADRDFHVDVAATDATIPHPLELNPDKLCTTRVCACRVTGLIHIESITDFRWRTHLKAHAIIIASDRDRYGQAFDTAVSRVYTCSFHAHCFQYATEGQSPPSINAFAVVNMELSDNLHLHLGSLGMDSFTRALDAAIHLAEGTVGFSCHKRSLLHSLTPTDNRAPEPCARVPVTAAAIFCRLVNTAVGMHLTANFDNQVDLGSRAVNNHILGGRAFISCLQIRSVRGSSIFCERTKTTAASKYSHLSDLPTYLLQWKALPTGIDVSMRNKRHSIETSFRLLHYTRNLITPSSGQQCLCRFVASMISLHIALGTVGGEGVTEAFIRTFGAHDPTSRMRKSAPVCRRQDLHASSAGLWGAERAFAHESEASTRTKPAVYALDVDTYDSFDVDVNDII